MENKTVKSKMLRAMTRDGSARIMVVNSRDMVNQMREAHTTSPTATAALGRTITAASMIGTMLPEDGDTVTITFAGDGEAGKIIAVGDYFGNVKGYIENPLANPPNSFLKQTIRQARKLLHFSFSIPLANHDNARPFSGYLPFSCAHFLLPIAVFVNFVSAIAMFCAVALSL